MTQLFWVLIAAIGLAVRRPRALRVSRPVTTGAWWGVAVVWLLADGAHAVVRASGANAPVYPRQYVASNWQPEQGLPQSSVYDIAQDHDGYLWLATWGGLVRFDGVRFRVFTPADIPALGSGRVMALCATRSGSLWIGTRDGSLIHLDDDRITTYNENQGLPGTLIRSIREDRDGTVWVNTSGGVARVAGSRLKTYAGPSGTRVSEFYLEARDGSTWFQSGNDIVRLAPDGVTSSIPVFKPDGLLVREARDGSIVIAFNDRPRAIRYHNGAYADLRLPPRRAPHFAGVYPDAGVLAMAPDVDGELLLLTPGGFVRVVDGSLSGPDPLPLDANGAAPPKVLSLVVDREGNRWVGTVTTGLYRFRPAPLSSFGRGEGLSDSTFFSILQDRDGRIWLGGIDSLYWFEGRRFYRFPGLRDVRSIAQTRDGDLWFGGSGGLYRWRGGGLTRFPIDAPAVSSIIEDRHGTLWVLAPTYDRPGGLFRFRDGAFDRFASDVHRFVDDRNGGLWIALPHGLQHVREGRTELYERKLASVSDMRLDSTGTLWIAEYGGGLLRFRDGRFTPLGVTHGLPNSFPDALLVDAGDLWVGSDRGVLRFSLKDLNDVADGTIRSLVPVVYGVPEGMTSAECNSGGPGVWKTVDGRIWFPTVRGVVAIDPNAGVRVPPPVSVEEASVNTRMLARDHRTSVPPGKGAADFRFSALSLFDSEDLRFRYRLDPFDEEWVDAGTRRTAHYTNLPPGDYAFHVIAANSFGVWNEKGDTIRFVLQPHYYQANWFRALCALALVSVSYAAYRFRLRRLRHAFERTLDARVDERTRIARELHDTLLQGAHGILLRFATVSHLLPDRPAQAKEAIDHAIEQTAAFIADARSEVQGLRGSVVQRNDLGAALNMLGLELAGPVSGRSPTFGVMVQGEPRELHPIVRAEIYKIAAEALRNAFRHGQAARVEAEIQYDNESVCLRVRDDGRGMDPRVSREGAEGHYGLGGMRERAALIGARLTIWSEVGSGTEVELHVPAAAAYVRPGKRAGRGKRSSSGEDARRTSYE